MKFHLAHFPVGTIIEVFVECVTKEPEQYEVSEIHCNGFNSWVLQTTTKDDLTGWKAFNMCYVTRIIKRGTGSYKVSEWHPNVKAEERVLTKIPRYSPKARHLKKDINEGSSYYERRQIYGLPAKPKNSYSYYSPFDTVMSVAKQFIDDSMLVNWEKLIDMLIDQGVIRSFDSWTAQTSNKKRLKKTIRRVLNKCLLNRAKTQTADDSAREEAYFDYHGDELVRSYDDDLYDDFDRYDDLYDDFDRIDTVEIICYDTSVN